MEKRRKLGRSTAEIACKYLGRDINDYIVHKDGKYDYYRMRISDEDYRVISSMANHNTPNKDYTKSAVENKTILKQVERVFSEDELKVMVDSKLNTPAIELHEIIGYNPDKDRNVGILLMSDWHSDEVVRPETVLNKNEFNKEIAAKRIDTFFFNAVKIIKAKRIDELIIGALGD